MYTQCPHCQTCFRVAEAHLKAAKGKVRCGSCKQIFDATRHLYDGIPSDQSGVKTSSGADRPSRPVPKPAATPRPTAPPAKKASPPPATPPVSTVEGFNEILPGGPQIPEHDHEHVDLSSPTGRKNAPDQSEFMQSIITENSQYNNLDDMGIIKIPGETDFTDSFIRFTDDDEEDDADTKQEHTETEAGSGLSTADFSDSIIRFADDEEEEEPTEAKSEPVDNLHYGASNPYADTDKEDLPATTEEQAGIMDLYSAADEQLLKGEEALELGRAIEAMLENELAFDDDSPETKPTTETPVTKKPSLNSDFEQINLNPGSDNSLQILDDEKEKMRKEANKPLEHVHAEDIWSRKKAEQPVKTQAAEKTSELSPPGRPGSDNDEDENQSGLHIDLSSDFGEFPAAPNDNPSDEDSLAEESVEADLKFDAMDALRLDRDRDDDDQPGNAGVSIKTGEVDIENDLPSMEHEIPKALRSSFEAYDAPTRPVGLTIAMTFGVVVLVIGLLIQVVLFKSYQLANNYPSLEPTLTSLCELLPCRYSGSSDLSKIEVLNRDMRSHPTQKNALLVSTTFVNKADFDQPYPVVGIKLFDLSGDTVATRYFNPKEYLDKVYSKFLLMESGTPVHITLEVLDPGDDAVNFEFSFK